MVLILKVTTEKVSITKALIAKASTMTVLINIIMIAKATTGKGTIAKATITAVLIEKDTIKKVIPAKIGKLLAINSVRAVSLFCQKMSKPIRKQI